MEFFRKNSRIVKYVVSGGSAAAVNVGSFAALIYFWEMWYLAASAVAFLLAFGVSFSLQKFWTFRDMSTDKVHEQAGIYMLISLVNLAATITFMFVLVEGVYGLWLAGLVPADHWKVFSQVLVNGLMAFVSFFAYRWLFIHRKA